MRGSEKVVLASGGKSSECEIDRQTTSSCEFFRFEGFFFFCVSTSNMNSDCFAVRKKLSKIMYATSIECKIVK